ncbi:MAG: hypothetical protein U1A27_07130 [Phycisphaerae bacterium]
MRDLGTTDRMSRGLAIVLPGIEGRSVLNYDIARGLDEGGVSAGIEIFDWNVPIPGGAILNVVDYDRNVDQAVRLAKKIMNYQDAYPGRPVHLIGHSGGAGMTVLTLEKLPRSRRITSAVLLAAAVSPRHDLRKALSRTEYGIFNYWSPADVSFLTIGTSLFGNIDRGYGPAAGAVGFDPPPGASGDYRKLHQIKYSHRMAAYGHDGGHIGWASRPWVRKYLAPLIAEQQASPWREVD